jgi:hypothetical protein
MVALGGGQFLMSEVPLYSIQATREALERICTCGALRFEQVARRSKLTAKRS